MTSMILLKFSMAVFVVSNLLEMGLKLKLEDAFRGLRNLRFMIYTLVWGFVIGPALAYAITLIIPLEPPYALGLIFMGMAPSTSFLPLLVDKAKGDLGFTAAFMLTVSIVTIIFMPLAVPVLAKGITVNAWTIAKPLLLIVFLPMVIGILIRRWNIDRANKISPIVKKITSVFAWLMIILCIIEYGKGFVGVAGSFAVISQVIFFTVLSTAAYWLSFGLKHEQRIILSIGMSTRNLGAALAPLFSIASMDERAIIMVVLGLPLMVIFARLAAKLFGRQTGESVESAMSSARNTSQT